MKHAKLWKRILHEKLDNYEEYRYGVVAEEHLLLASKIITAHIITTPLIDTRLPVTSDEDDEKILTPEDLNRAYSNLMIPFDSLWIEFADSDPNYLDGRYLASIPMEGGGWEVVMWNILAGPFPPRINPGRCVFRIKDGRVSIDGFKHQSFDTGNKADPEISGGLAVVGVAHVCSVLELLSCKNVDLSPRENDPKQVRIATKRHGPSPTGYRYHVLTVRPAGSKPGTPGEEIGNMPRHVCRGHFAEYGPKFGKGLLFGKYEGRFYVPPHMKGKAENGIVEKDYRVVAV